MKTTPRVRFAPAPTGMMHLGNVRTALMNFLFAQQKQGTFIIRIEDTDTARNYDPKAEEIIRDLTWLGLEFDEGPGKGGPYEPYFQSQRTSIYKEKLTELISKGRAYRCFCSPEELEKKRARQIALKMPPRYDRACLKLSEAEIAQKLAQKVPFIWRVKLDQSGIVDIHDMAHGTIHFELKNFYDFPLTRQDESFTFIFANFVDDMLMKISHVIRGEDHLSNTACQAMLYKAFEIPLPVFWHLPIICNTEGKKLSKRDFGFSLRDLKNAGFLPEAICNYLAIIGGSFEHEIMSLEELAKTFNFENVHSTGHIRYDVEKLKWINHKWIASYSESQLTDACLPYLSKAYPQVTSLDKNTISRLIQNIKTELHTLQDVVTALGFYFQAPQITHQQATAAIPGEYVVPITNILAHTIDQVTTTNQLVELIKNTCKQQNIPLKEMFSFVRMALLGSPKGASIHELADLLGIEETKERIKKVLD